MAGSGMRTVALWSGAGALAVCLLPLVAMVGLSGSRLTDGDAQQQDAFDSAEVPAAHVKWVIRAGSVCDTVPPSVVAAQIDAETGWGAGPSGTPSDPAASPDPATSPDPVGSEPPLVRMGPADFERFATDEDGNGRISPQDPGDTIMALGRFDCALAEGVQQLLEQGRAAGDPLELTLAAAHSGLDAVERGRGMPPGEEARGYVRAVQRLIPRYETGSGG